jgi:hypothetical protein
MLVIAVVAVIAAAGFILVVAAAVLVTIGVRQEERLLTFARQRGPTAIARLARRIVGRYVRPAEPEPRPASERATTPAAPGEPGAISTARRRNAA